MVAALGGPRDLLREARASTCRRAGDAARCAPERAGVVTRIDARAVGLAVMGLGGGRRARTTRSTTPSGSRDVAPVGAPGRPGPAAGGGPRARRGGRRGGRAALRAAVTRRRRGAAGARPSSLAARVTRRAIPKAELHVHLEGTAPPALIRRLAERNGMTRARGVFARRRPLRAGRDFLDFLRTYDLAASVIRTAAGLPRRHLRVPGRVRAREGAVYVELIASPDHAARGRARPTPSTSAASRRDRRRARRPRHRGAASSPRPCATSASSAAEASPAGSPTTAIPTSSASTSPATRPASRRRSSPTRLRDRRRAPASAARSTPGEHAGPESVRGALALPVTRISHGVRAIEDPALVAELAERGIVLEVCPTSNVVLGRLPSYEDHPLRCAARRRCEGHAGLRRPALLRSVRSAASTPLARERFGFERGAS